MTGTELYSRLSKQIVVGTVSWCFYLKSKKISNVQELIQSDATSCPQNQKGNN